MLFNIALIIIAALVANFLFEKIRLPGILGMIFVGAIFGPNFLNVISPSVLNLSSDLRIFALIIILIRAGLGISRTSLNQVGSSVIKMSFIPCIFEGISVGFLGYYLLGFSVVESGMFGFIISAVSLAIVVPFMLNLQNGFDEKKILQKNQKNQKIQKVKAVVLAGTSMDNVCALTIFAAFLTIYKSGNNNILSIFIKIPISIIFGILIGLVLGFLLVKFFKKYHIRDTKKVLIFVVLCIFFHNLENYFLISSLLGIMVMGFVILEKYEILAKRLSSKFSKIWIFAEIFLFVLIGSQLNINLILKSSFLGVIIILAGLLFRSLGVIISLAGSKFNTKEKLFCVISYIPKATVQAAIGSIPLACGMKNGETILAIAILSILITAPLGSFGMKILYTRLLNF